MHLSFHFLSRTAAVEAAFLFKWVPLSLFPKNFVGHYWSPGPTHILFFLYTYPSCNLSFSSPSSSSFAPRPKTTIYISVGAYQSLLALKRLEANCSATHSSSTTALLPVTNRSNNNTTNNTPSCYCPLFSFFISTSSLSTFTYQTSETHFTAFFLSFKPLPFLS